jgi:hypothetical protein
VTKALYRRLLGERFDGLPQRVRALHDLSGSTAWQGRADVERGRALISRLVAALASLPASGDDQALWVTFAARASREIWSRRFGRSRFGSVQYERGGLLNERVGPTTFVFTPIASAQGLALRLDGFKVFGIPLPAPLHPKVRTFEYEHADRYHFEVEVALPVVGLLVRYSGWLEPSDGSCEPRQYTRGFGSI